MLYGLLVTIFIINAFLLALLILIQQSKGDMGLGSIGGGAQMIFGGSGGQEFLQKATWVLATIFMAGSLILALMRARNLESMGHRPAKRSIPTTAPAPARPVVPSAPAEGPAKPVQP